MTFLPWYRRDQYREVIAVAVFTAVFLGLQWLGVADTAIAVGERLARPVTEVGMKAAHEILAPVHYLRQSYKAARRVQQLELEYSQALAKITQLEELERENEVLREILSAQEKQLPSLIATPIVSYGHPSLSLGTAEGVISGAPVIANGVLLGLVDTVSSHQSTVTLLSQLRQPTILAKTESGATGLITGDARKILLTELLVDTELKSGERVMTVGQAQIPANIFIGTVGQVVSNQAAASQTVVVEQLVSFYELAIVEVIP